MYRLSESLPSKHCRGGGMPRPLTFDTKAVKIDAVTDGTEQSLPLEGKVVRLKPDRMRSKVTASYRLMVIIDRFDLISRN